MIKSRNELQSCVAYTAQLCNLSFLNRNCKRNHIATIGLKLTSLRWLQRNHKRNYCATANEKQRNCTATFH